MEAGAKTSWRPEIKVTHENHSSKQATSFLDLWITISRGHIAYKTFRKPMNTYQYLPRTSCHSAAVFKAIVHTEAFRLLVTNRAEVDYTAQINFFKQKLVHRGYLIHEINQVLEKYSWSQKEIVLKKKNKEKNNMGKLVAFKCQFFGALPKLKIAAILKEHSKVLDPLYRSLRPIACILTAPSLFRLRYSLFL